MSSIVLLVLCLCLVSNIFNSAGNDARSIEDTSYLKILNKPPIHSIHTKFGDIIDCVDINKQPAFDHPLLKNHKLQREPSFLNQKRTTKKEDDSEAKSFEFELENEACPIGSVPIRRTTKDDLIRMRSISNYTNLLLQNSDGSLVASLVTNKNNNYSYLGVGGDVNVQNPRVQKVQMSLAQMAVQNGAQDGINSILLGWHVAPQLYVRKTTNVFALWTSDSFKETGCYNMDCPGFIQTDRKIFLGTRVLPCSLYGGDQYQISMSISQDPRTKNWWLRIQDKDVGYYPRELFSNMASADLVGWGGKVYGVFKETSPQMGSGYFPDGDLSHACYMSKLSYNVNGQFQDPQDDRLTTFLDNKNCYDITNLGFMDDIFRYTFQFGGPGGKCI